jgi:hypothetical protein
MRAALPMAALAFESCAHETSGIMAREPYCRGSRVGCDAPLDPAGDTPAPTVNRAAAEFIARISSMRQRGERLIY